MSLFDELLQRALDNYAEVFIDEQDRMRERFDRFWGKRDPEKEWRGLEAFLNG